MKKIILQNGLKAGIGIFIVNILLMIFVGEKMPYHLAETVGWIIIVLACSFVFLGIQQYRDKENGGRLKFVEALKVGSLISLFPSIGIFIFEVILWTFSGKELIEYFRKEAEKTMSPEEYQQMMQMLDTNPMYTNPVFQATVMFATVFLTGLAITVLAGFILKKH